MLLIALILGIISRVNKNEKVGGANWKRFLLEFTLEVLFIAVGLPEITEFYAEEYLRGQPQILEARERVEQVEFHI